MFIERRENGIQIKKKEVAKGLVVAGLVYGGARLIHKIANPEESFRRSLLNLADGVGGLVGCTVQVAFEELVDGIKDSGVGKAARKFIRDTNDLYSEMK